MKSANYTNYGAPSVLSLVETDKPIPAANELLIKVQATSVTSGDTRLRSMNFPTAAQLIVRLVYGVFKPKQPVLGHEFAGVVEAVGSEVKHYKVGDAVFGTPTLFGPGTYSEYICVAEQREKGVLALKPSNLSFGQAAVLPVGSMTALFLLNRAKIMSGSKVLVYGASGSVGSYAVQIAIAKSAQVTAMCSAYNFDLMESLGVDDYIDYRTQGIGSIPGEFDVIFDAVGKVPKKQAKTKLAKNGQFLSVTSITSPTQEHLDQVINLVNQGLLTPLIDRTFTLDDIISAHEYVDAGHKKGNVVVEIKP